MNQLAAKYNIPAPRYTSYPTVPYWNNLEFSENRWIKSLLSGMTEKGNKTGISLYIHLPFCESLCTFCGCNKRITKDHSVEQRYIKAVLKEWDLYLDRLPVIPLIRELHLGGGTPTFFSAENLSLLISGIISKAQVAENVKFSFEGNPQNTTREHLVMLYNLGFRRVSLGVQDFDPEVQKAINRVQDYNKVQQITAEARSIGYDSVNYDLVYGLPFQEICSVVNTIEKVSMLKPDRIAFYSYAHVPWIKGVGQRKFSEENLPSASQKLALYETGKKMLQAAGYEEIGMDHFALPEDDLFKAFSSGTLNRNFMGYTDQDTELTLGLGVSSISDSFYGMSQNAKKLEDYYDLIERDFIPVVKGHILTAEDIITRSVIHDLMCKMEVTLGDDFPNRQIVMDRLLEPFADNLIEMQLGVIKVTPKGRSFLRNICLAFDLRFWEDQPKSQIFSMAV